MSDPEICPKCKQKYKAGIPGLEAPWCPDCQVAEEIDLEKEKAYHKYAKDNLHKDGELEIDDYLGTKLVSLSESGAYVQAWIWVPEDVLENTADKSTTPQTHKDTGGDIYSEG